MFSSPCVRPEQFSSSAVHCRRSRCQERTHLGTVALRLAEDVILNCRQEQLAGCLPQRGKRPHRVGDVLRLELLRPSDDLSAARTPVSSDPGTPRLSSLMHVTHLVGKGLQQVGRVVAELCVRPCDVGNVLGIEA